VGPVEHALALWLGSWDVGDGPPVVGAVLLLAKQAAQRVVEVAVAVVGGGDAREHVAEEARGAEAADAVCVAHGGVGVVVLAGDVLEAGAVALRGGTARLVSAVVVVVLLQPVQRASPGRGLLLDVKQSLRVRVVPGPVILDVAEPLLHWRCCALLRRVACGVQACHSQMQHALLAQLEAETVAGDVVLGLRARAVSSCERVSVPLKILLVFCQNPVCRDVTSSSVSRSSTRLPTLPLSAPCASVQVLSRASSRRSQSRSLLLRAPMPRLSTTLPSCFVHALGRDCCRCSR